MINYDDLRLMGRVFVVFRSFSVILPFYYLLMLEYTNHIFWLLRETNKKEKAKFYANGFIY